MGSCLRGRVGLSILLGLSLLALVGCGAGHTDGGLGPDPGVGGALIQSKVARAPVAASVDFTDTATGMRRLGHDLSAQLPADSGQGGNQVFSPASLAIAFAMLREGAGAASARGDRPGPRVAAQPPGGVQRAAPLPG